MLPLARPWSSSRLSSLPFYPAARHWPARRRGWGGLLQEGPGRNTGGPCERHTLILLLPPPLPTLPTTPYPPHPITGPTTCRRSNNLTDTKPMDESCNALLLSGHKARHEEEEATAAAEGAGILTTRSHSSSPTSKRGGRGEEKPSSPPPSCALSSSLTAFEIEDRLGKGAYGVVHRARRKQVYR